MIALPLEVMEENLILQELLKFQEEDLILEEFQAKELVNLESDSHR